ncbi:MAG: arsenite efflux transporter metallochaperone ArsD [Candidatus Aenigmarchaeota archaeon]|nr:arsenite efflux transporter metallochaperone ArsD [Candidatus Aenigmarchaeota archaeon]
MAKIDLIIFESAMCCSTGVCGPEPNKTLVEFNETVKKLQKDFNGLNIMRANMTFNIDMFLENKDIFQIIKEKGPEVLPITVINGKVIAKQEYPRYDELKREIEKVV